ncbi:Flp pilus assembly protein CpaB [Pseudarthrobacter sulfonivorans]|uniref:Flp pilus assembly protein CpaB n=1 Tax=Pseudarthrobacter sulfonivorans TaxID=121292 RepID=UPI002105982E|nr:RcpC/CpaB family pilus assembly protein [Pseudarthrobacter sulfonivorans]
MKSRMLAGTAAVALALVGALLIIFYAQGADQRAIATTQPVDVLIVKNAIPAGTPVDAMAASLVVQRIPAAGVSKTALGNLDSKAGTVSAVDLVPGEQLLAERLVAPADAASEGAAKVPAGFQEVSFQLEPQRMAGGRIEVGDHVGIAMSFKDGAYKPNPAGATTQLTLRKVLITAVQRAPQPTATKSADNADPKNTTLPEGSLMLTVAVNDIDANKIIFGSEFGTLWLTKEPLDAKDNGSYIARKDVVYK